MPNMHPVSNFDYIDTCSKCKQEIPAGSDRITVDLTSNFAIIDKKQYIKLRPREAEFLSILVKKHPRPVHYESFLLGIYGRYYNEEIPTKGNLIVSACHIRKKLSGTGIKIINSDSSYYLDEGLTDKNAVPYPTLANETIRIC